MATTPYTYASSSDTSGPRAKCDQVVFEAIAKACEIVVTGRRCSEDTSDGGTARQAASAWSSAASGSPSSSSRFNLHVPEVARIRAILQRTRGALHVPLRLDVFCEQPNGGERLLLERWCLEYRTMGIENFLTKEAIVGDAIVQLRHVCKRVVIWLRTLCCWIRLLPAQTINGNVGFSLYHHDDNVTELLQQGFLLEQPQSMVTTPYGELFWRVVYTPHIRQAASASVTRPIPIPRSMNARPYGGEPPTPAEGQNRFFLAPKSAPQKAPTNWQAGMDASTAGRHALTGTNTYDPSRFHQRRIEASVADAQQQFIPPSVLRRRHTDMETIEDHADGESLFASTGDKPPTRVLSGLSLALLEHGKRRAFHEIPPHIVEHQLQQLERETSQFGYAYNHHVPWEAIKPSESKPIDTAPPPRSDDQRYNRNTSPHMFTSPPLASTPPSAVFLRSPSPLSSPFFHPSLQTQQLQHFPSASSTVQPTGGSDLLSSTPPFRPRPATLEPSRGMTQRQELSRQIEALPLPLDSLDASPFEASQQLSLGGAGVGPLAAGRSRLLSEHANPMTLLGSNLDLRRSLFAGGGTSTSSFVVDGNTDERVADEDEDEDEEDLPFAVDPGELLSSSTSVSGRRFMATPPSSSSHDASASAIEFAQKLGKLHTRPMFVSSNHASAANPSSASADADQLADQLSEFRSFGASLNLVGNGSVGSEGGVGASELVGGSSSTSTPISLRT
jgi:hypothetical protein